MNEIKSFGDTLQYEGRALTLIYLLVIWALWVNELDNFI